MEKKCFFILLLLMLCWGLPSLEAQGFIKVYGGALDDEGRCVVEVPGTGYIVAGYSADLTGSSIYVLRTNLLGDTLWSRLIGGSQGLSARSIIRCANGGYIIAGNDENLDKAFLLKISPNGDSLWLHRYGGTGANNARSAAEDGNGNIIFVGETTSFGSVGADVYLVKTDSLGGEIWSDHYGGSSAQVGEEIILSNDGCYVVTGWSLSNSPDSIGVLLMKIDTLGSVIWEKYYGGYNCAAYSLIATPDSGFAVLGHNADFAGGVGWQYWLLKTDSNGDTLWTRTYGGESEDWALSIDNADSTGYILCGYTYSYGAGESDAYLIRTDLNGDTLWTRTYGSPYNDWGYCIKNTVDGGFIFTGFTGFGQRDVFLVKTDGNGYITGIHDGSQAIPSRDRIRVSCYPNPFARWANIAIDAEKPGRYALSVFNVQGQLVRKVFDGHLTAGVSRVEWDGRDETGARVKSGVYFGRLADRTFVLGTARMVLVR